jgi:Zn-dependent M28 family amino/carboxypeptidase
MNPYFPLKKTVANLNLDMVSRTWTKESLKRVSRWMGIKMDKEMLKKIEADNFIAPSFAAQAPQLEKAIRKSNQHVGMSIFLRASKTGMGGSDHAPFAMKKLPWVFFGAAMTKDYHQPTDSVEKVSFKLMEKITRLTYLTAFILADQ